jgi:hypothetical protein
MRSCVRCKTRIPQARLDILPDTHTCVQCSTVQRYVGCNIYTSKTTPELFYVRPENSTAVETHRREYRRARK